MIIRLEKPHQPQRWLALAIAVLVTAGLWAVDEPMAFAATVSVQARDFAFTPADVTVRVGDSITWTNGDAESHAVEGGVLSSPEIRPGESYSTTFTEPGESVYFCRFHTYMTGTVHVVPAGQAVASPTTAPPTTVPPTTVAPPEVAPPTEEEAPTTTAPAPVVRPSGPRGSSFQDVPDDPSARKPPGTASASQSTAATPPTTTPPVSRSGGSTPAPGSSSGGSTTPTTSARSAEFQEVPHDPSAGHAPGEVASLAAAEASPADDGSPPAAAGEPLGDGTYLAPFDRVGDVKEFHLTLTETTIEVSPGVVKQAYAFNGVVPGPVIRVNEGDRVRIVVDNQLPFPTATHWHGMILPNDQDGVGGITQPHIEPGGRYVYEWTAVATGTHWYHAHSSGRHIGKGLYGPLEVVPRTGDFESDHDYRVMLGDTDLGFTINGRSFPSTPTFATKVGEVVRLRVINTGDQVHAFHLHGVPFKVVAQDGIPREQPEGMDTLTIAPGQTYDLLFSEVYPGKWLIHCHMFVHSHMTGDEHPPGESGMNGMVAIVDVQPSSDDESEPSSASSVLSDGLDLGDLIPLSTNGAVGSPTVGLVLLALVLAGMRYRRRAPSPSTPQQS